MHRAEVAEGVQEHQQRPRAHGGGDLGDADAPEYLERSVAQHPGALLQGARQLPQAGRHRQIHVRVGHQRQHEPGAVEAPQLRSAVQADPGEKVVGQAAGIEGVDERGRADKGGKDQGQRQQHPPQPAPGKVGAGGEPRQRGAQHQRSARYRHREPHRAPQRPERAVADEQPSRVGALREVPVHQVHAGEREPQCQRQARDPQERRSPGEEQRPPFELFDRLGHWSGMPWCQPAVLLPHRTLTLALVSPANALRAESISLKPWQRHRIGVPIVIRFA